MRSRLFNFLSCLLLSATAVQSAQAVDLTTQRQYYDQAKRALAKGDSGPYMQYSQALADYLGVERSALSTEIGKLRREGILESDRSSFHLLKL